jgi:hypothetical protein
MRTKLKDRNAIQQCETTIRESTRRLEFLEQELQRLNFKKNRATTNVSAQNSPASFYSNDGQSPSPSHARTFPGSLG